MSFLTTVGLLGLAASPAAAFWRLPCKDTLVVERADPIVSPGKVSGHVHQIMGGNAFDFSMTYNETQDAACSSCTVKVDYSNYWTPVLYYQAEDGTFEKVDQIGGGLVYYLQRQGPNNDQLKAFPEGFRMVAGNPWKRSGGDDFPSQAVSYNCLDYNAPAKPETGGFPNYNCASGLRSQLFFPSCWDGVNLDPPDHESHMSYPIGAYNDGACPSSHPVHLISIFFEIIWDTNKFADRWYGNGQPFVWSMGDPTGYGFHGDFLNGWDVNLLQRAVDECTNLSGQVEDCPVFNLWPDSTAQGCKVGSKVNEVVDGVMNQLPGCNPVQNGPGTATPQSTCTGNITNAISAAKTTFQDLTGSGWSYQGCGTDNFYNRALTGATYRDAGMTNAACVAFCDSKGFSIAGTEYADECYCANSIPDANAPLPGVMGDCSMPCAGDSSNATMCGGAAALSLYKKCTSNPCTNVATNTDGDTYGGSGSGSGSGYAAPSGGSSSAAPSSSSGGSAPPANQVQSPSSTDSGSSTPAPWVSVPSATKQPSCKAKKRAAAHARSDIKSSSNPNYRFLKREHLHNHIMKARDS